MVATVRIVFGNGTTRIAREYADLAEATSAAFELADRHGLGPVAGADHPERVQVVIDDRVELSIRILSGGLRPRDADRP